LGGKFVARDNVVIAQKITFYTEEFSLLMLKFGLVEKLEGSE
jgi:hypothetical protein